MLYKFCLLYGSMNVPSCLSFPFRIKSTAGQRGASEAASGRSLQEDQPGIPRNLLPAAGLQD